MNCQLANLETELTLRKTLKFRLYTNRRNRHLNDAINCAGIAWNHITALQKTNRRLGGKYIHKYEISGHMSKLRRRGKHGGRFAYLQQVPSQALQEICSRHDKAYQAFFNYIKKGGAKRMPPKFKKIKKYKSFTLSQAGWKLMGGNRIRIGKFVYKFSKSRHIHGVIKTVTIKRDLLDRFWVCFSVVQTVAPNKTSTGKIGGFDFGLQTFLTDQDGGRTIYPDFGKMGSAEIGRLNNALARKRMDSNNRKKAKHALTKAHERIANQRDDWQWKVAHDLTDRFDVLRFEDLNLDRMKRLWGRKVSDLGFD